MKNHGENRIEKAYIEIEKNEFKYGRIREWCKKRSILYGAVSVTSQHANTAQYFTLLKQRSKFFLGLNTAKNMPCIKKCLK